MKKLVNFFLWFCAATFLAQFCIFAIGVAKGNVNSKTLSQVIALLNGIDIQSERFKGALISSRAVATPSYQDVLDAKTNALLQQDSRGRALDTYQRRLDETQRKLEEDVKRFDQRREEYMAAKESKEAGADAEKLSEMRKFIELLEPEMAKQLLVSMLENGSKSDVVAILRGMPPDKQKKILAEFTGDADQQKLAEVLKEIRNGEPLKNLQDNAPKTQP
jgi:hypothetical protein